MNDILTLFCYPEALYPYPDLFDTCLYGVTGLDIKALYPYPDLFDTCLYGVTGLDNLSSNTIFVRGLNFSETGVFSKVKTSVPFSLI